MAIDSAKRASAKLKVGKMNSEQKDRRLKRNEALPRYG